VVRLRAAVSAFDDVSPRRAVLLRLADATRRAIDGSMSTGADNDTVAAAAELVERAAALLTAAQHGRPYEGTGEESTTGDRAHHTVDYSPFVGLHHPFAPPLRLAVEGDTVVARGSFGAAYEGPPGCVHGGFVAAAFDEVLGFAQSLPGRPGMTGRLTIAYRSPTPLHQPLELRARVDRVDGRKIHTSAELRHEGRLCAEAEGLFISVDPAVFERLLRERR